MPIPPRVFNPLLAAPPVVLLIVIFVYLPLLCIWVDDTRLRVAAFDRSFIDGATSSESTRLLDLAVAAEVRSWKAIQIILWLLVLAVAIRLVFETVTTLTVVLMVSSPIKNLDWVIDSMERGDQVAGPDGREPGVTTISGQLDGLRSQRARLHRYKVGQGPSTAECFVQLTPAYWRADVWSVSVAEMRVYAHRFHRRVRPQR